MTTYILDVIYKDTRMYVIISINYCLLTNMIVIVNFTHVLGAPTGLSKAFFLDFPK